MVEYYNLTNIGGDGVISFFRNINTQLSGTFSIFLILSLALILIIYYSSMGVSLSDITLITGLYLSIFSFLLYLAGMVAGLVVFVFVIIMALAVAMRWFKR